MNRINVSRLMREVKEEEDRLDQIMRLQRLGSQQTAQIKDDLSSVRSDLTAFREDHRKENNATQTILASLSEQLQMIRLDIAQLQQNPPPGVQGPQNDGQVHPQLATRDMILTCTGARGTHEFRFTLKQLGSGVSAKVVCPRCHKTFKNEKGLRNHIRKGTKDCQCRCSIRAQAVFRSKSIDLKNPHRK